MTEEQLLKSHLSDLAKRAYNQNIYTYSNFLSPDHLYLLDSISKDFNYIHMETYGGNELCERQIVSFGSEEEFGYAGTFPICVIQVRPLIEKFSDSLTHRDYLGALMHLGIERELIGDIFIKEKTAYIFCIDRISQYICDELTKVKHTNVMCEITDTNIPALAPTLVDKEFPVTSLRLDNILATLLKCSRKESLTFFEEKRVTLNGKITGRNSILLKDGDIFSVRGHGKFIYIGSGGSTRKGKIYVHVKQYV